MFERLRQLYRYRALIQILIQRELKARYRGTFLGFLWSFLNPFILMGIYVLVFSVYFRVEMENYPAFLLCGILPWAWFSSSLNEATSSIISNGGLIKKVYLPSEVFPLIFVGSNMIHFLMSIPILLFFLAFFEISLSWIAGFFLIVLVIQFIFTLGLVLITSSLAVKFRDLLQVVPNLLMFWFFITPILYPVSMVPEGFRFFVELNPMALILQSYQDIFFFNKSPSVISLAISGGLACFLLVIGFSFFEARREVFAEEV
jgi:ABC-type polysaccharide/polyol phosphate export permease